MCRLYGFRANEPTKVECTLVHAQNALLLQSLVDARGQANADGWGIATYDDGEPTVERRTTAAYGDLHFSVAAERVYARCVVAHIRQATVGATGPENTHPFVHGPWTFAHNGTVRRLDVLRDRLEAEIAESIDFAPAGETDSELAFCWLLARMRRSGLDPERPADDVARLAELVGEAVVELDRRGRAAGTELPPRLNFLITDGRSLVASRWNNTLYWVEREGVHDCEICGVPHVEHDPRRDYRAVVVASEPISHEAWRELEQGELLSVDAGIRARIDAV